MKIIHFKGFHFSFPPSIKTSSSSVLEWEVDFTDAKYDHKNNDQYDWNKLCGIKWSYFKPRLNTLMVGWRYVNNNYELCFYIHKDGSFNPPAEPLFITDRFAKISLVLDDKNKKATLSIEGKNLDLKKEQTIDWELFGKYYFIDSWFGGNLPVPRTLSFNLIENKNKTIISIIHENIINFNFKRIFFRN